MSIDIFKRIMKIIFKYNIKLKILKRSTHSNKYKEMKKIMSIYNMNTRALNDLTKDQLINLVLEQKQKIKVLFQKIEKQKLNNDDHDVIQPPSEFRDKPVPTPRKNVKQMVQEYEDNIIQPPLEFRDKPVPLPRTKKPVPLPRTKIEQVKKALKGYSKSFEISIINNRPFNTITKHKKSS